MSHVNRKSATHQRTTILTWQEALAIIETCDERGVPKPFAVTFCTADEDKDTGGEIIHYPKAVWHVAGGRVRKNDTFERISAKRPKKESPKLNWTRLIRAIDTDQPRRIHLHLISNINGLSVE